MEQHAASHTVVGVLSLLILSVILAIMAYALAKEKERRVVLWTVLGTIPFLNMFCVWFLVGATNLRLERKVDDLLNRSGP